MYTIKVDGQEIYSPALSDDPLQIISPRLQLEAGTAGSLSFTIPPGHGAHDSISKMKSLVTVEWDGKEIFRGRASEEKVDAYNQKETYCEGALSFLMDSVQRPFAFSGTALEYCTQAIATHNTQVEASKRFTIGDFSALTDATVLNLEGDGYTDTLSAIQAVLAEHEGFLLTRYANGVNYLDFVTRSGANNGQTIEFGVNLVDYENQARAEEICTVMLPIGGMLDDGTTVTIASVNNGSDVLENAEAIAQYGRIVKTYAFDNVTDPAELMAKARAKLDSMAIGQTLTLQAVDMHILDKGKGIILPGVPVVIHTLPHGVDKEDVCISVDLDLENPEKATYVFGQPARTQSGAAAMIANQVRTHTRTVQHLYKHYTETDYTVKIHTGLLNSHDEYLAQAQIELDGINATIDLKADKTTTDELTTRLSSAEVAIDGANAAIATKANQTTVAEQGKRLSAAEVLVDGVAASLSLKASIEDVNNLAERVSAAEASILVNANGIESKVSKNGIISAINQTAESVKISASKINLDGYVTATELETEFASMMDGYAAEFSTTDFYASTASIGDGLTAGYVSANTVMADASMTVGGAEVATQTWVNGKDYATHTYVTTALKPYALIANISSEYLKKSALTTQTVSFTYVYDVTATGTVPVRSASGSVIGQAITGITESTATKTITYVTYA